MMAVDPVPFLPAADALSLTPVTPPAPMPVASVPPPPGDASDVTAFLDQIMARLQLAQWEAWDSPLELIRVNFRGKPNPVWAFEPEQLIAGAPWEQGIYPRDRERVKAFLARSTPPHPRESIDYRLIVAEGELLWIRHWPLSRTPAANGRARLQGLLMAIPEQKHLEWECLRVSEHECNRIGQELHDDLCQVLTGLSFMMRVLGQRAARVAPTLAAEVNEVNTHVVAATNRVRSMAHGLFPAQLNYANLRTALKEFGDQIKARFKVSVSVELPRRLPAHNSEQIIHVFRIAQEAVTNAIRHGNARSIRLVITASTREIRMDVVDDGDGFLEPTARREGIGIHIMRYRAGVLGGRLEFENRSSRGAVVRLVYPATPLPAARRNPSRRKP